MNKTKDHLRPKMNTKSNKTKTKKMEMGPIQRKVEKGLLKSQVLIKREYERINPTCDV
jgi:hypothetical protein